MTKSTIDMGDWDDLNIHIVTNLFLYGQTSTPEDYLSRLRTAADYNDLPLVDGISSIKIQINMDSFMATGAGRYAFASHAKVVHDFFSQQINLSNGSYTKANLINDHGYSENDF